MALVIYSNGIVEEHVPVESVFSEKELTDSFEMYSELKTYRLDEIANCWCLYGNIVDPPENEFNKLASEIVDADVYSHLVFIHDSELELGWELTDSIIYKPYKEFLLQVGEFINDITTHIGEENIKEYENSDKTNMIFLSALGYTKDKRTLLAFNPNEQHEDFYFDGGWENFATKIHEYLVASFDLEPIEENKPFVIFSDSKTIVIIEDKDVDNVIGKMVDTFESKEQYEYCATTTEMKDKWYSRKTLPSTIDASSGSVKKKRGRPPKKKPDEETE